MLDRIRAILAKVVFVIDTIESVIIVIILSGAVFVGTWQVLARFVFKSSLHWSEEMLLMGFIWVTFIGASLGVSRCSHLAVDFFVDRLPPRPQYIVCLSAHVITVIFSIVAFWLSVRFFMQSHQRGQLSAAMEIPMILPYSGLVLAFGCMIVQSLKVTLDFVALRRDGLKGGVA